MPLARQVVQPPDFLRLAAHPVRWTLLAALAESDLRVRELVARVGQPQNLVSYHLRLLRGGGLVRSRRSSHDGRDTYYHLALERCAEALGEAGAALHPALRPALDRPAPAPRHRGGHARAHRPAVLFVCTGNSARSPIAEALLRHHAGGAVMATSAGTRPKRNLHPQAVTTLLERFGLDLSGRRPRDLDSVTAHRPDHVITLCDRAREALPPFPHQPRTSHWSIPDPALGTAGLSRAAFQDVVTDIDSRIRCLLPVLTTTNDGGDRP